MAGVSEQPQRSHPRLRLLYGSHAELSTLYSSLSLNTADDEFCTSIARNIRPQRIVQQLREALALPCPYRYVLFDRDAKFGNEVFAFLKSSGIEPVRTSLRSPWQNGIAERWVGSARRELLDHVIPLDEHHLRRLARECLAYYHQDRTHITLDKSTPGSRVIEAPLTQPSQIQSQPRVGGIHHRYSWAEAA
jgi:putative transposase